MSAGLQDFVTINLSTLASAFGADEVVTIGALQEKRILNLSGREAKLPLKVRLAGHVSGVPCHGHGRVYLHGRFNAI